MCEIHGMPASRKNGIANIPWISFFLLLLAGISIMFPEFVYSAFSDFEFNWFGESGSPSAPSLVFMKPDNLTNGIFSALEHLHGLYHTPHSD